MSDSLFRIMEEVMAQRDSGKVHPTVKQIIVDIMQAATKHGNKAMSTRDCYLILKKLGLAMTRSPVNRAVTDLRDEGVIEFVGKENREGIHQMVVPVYRLVPDVPDAD